MEVKDPACQGKAKYHNENIEELVGFNQ